MYLFDAFESYGTMAPSSTASLMSLEAVALFFSSIPTFRAFERRIRTS
jgi:hypothetical protein